MLIEVKGFILNEVAYKESSRIINVLTKEYGLIGVMCNGVKSIKNKNRVATMKLSYVNFNIKYKEKKLATLISADIIDPLKHLKSDIILVSYLTYISELTYQVVKQSSDYTSIYDDFINIVKKMESGLDPLVLTNILEIKYLNYLGILFDINECVKCKSKKDIATIDVFEGGYICKNCLRNEKLVGLDVVKMIRMYYYIDINKINKINVLKDTKLKINQFLDEYYDRFSGLFLGSKNFLKEVLKDG